MLLNTIPLDQLSSIASEICASASYVSAITSARPYSSLDELLVHSAQEIRQMPKDMLMMALEGHPRIGALRDLGEREREEQKGVLAEDDSVKRGLKHGNETYEKKFGFVFLVFATGKTGSEMLEIMNRRLHNDLETEIREAREELLKISDLRWRKSVAQLGGTPQD